jgi:hypothetical protein
LHDPVGPSHPVEEAGYPSVGTEVKKSASDPRLDQGRDGVTSCFVRVGAADGCDPPVTLVEVSGDLGMTDVQELAAVLDALCLRPPAAVVLDLSALATTCYSPLVLAALVVSELHDSLTAVEIRGRGAMVRHIFCLAGLE